MKTEGYRYIEELLTRYPSLEVCRKDIREAYGILESAYASGGKLLVVGNGGSAADAEHIVGELMKGFLLPRRVKEEYTQALTAADAELGGVLAERLQGALPAIALTGHPALSTAYMNDCDPLLCFAQQVNGYGCRGDVLLALSTSGQSRNILFAVTAARAKGIKVIGMTGSAESQLSARADVCIRVPEQETYRVQEQHLPIYHCLCMMLEAHFFGEEG